MLRNPNLTVYGTTYATNEYEIKIRTILPIDGSTVNVKVLLCCYTDTTQDYKVHETEYLLTGLTNDPTLLGPALYQTELINQHGSETLDGTLLSNFEVLS